MSLVSGMGSLGYPVYQGREDCGNREVWSLGYIGYLGGRAGKREVLSLGFLGYLGTGTTELEIGATHLGSLG